MLLKFDNGYYTPVWSLAIYWQIKELITLNLLLMVDEIVLAGINLSRYLDSVQSGRLRIVSEQKF